MTASRRLLPTLLALAGLAAPATAIAESLPFFLAGGISRLTDTSTREQTSNYGYHVTLGTSAPEQGLLGTPSLDIDWGRTTGHGNRIDSVGVLYAERAPLSQSFYYCLGIGSFYNNLAVDDGTGTGTLLRIHKWTIGGKGGLGFRLSSRFFVEADYFYSGTMSGETTNTAAACLGVTF